MKKFYLLTIVAGLFACVPKKLDLQPEDLVMQAITTGQWKVTSYIKGGNDITTDFASYKFQFKTNYTVDAINNGTVVNTGTWAANPDPKTITSNFTGSTHPLDLLNGTFEIYSTTWTSVKGGIMVNGEYRSLRLDKL
jgi:hypothetical protein